MELKNVKKVKKRNAKINNISEHLNLIKSVFASLIFLGSFLFYTHSAHAATYYIDYAGGLDSNNGTSEATPFQHAPGDSACTGNCASIVLHPGDSVVFKKGVTYADPNSIIAKWAGALVSNVSNASTSQAVISFAGVLTDPNATFQTTGVAAGMYIYIYNNVMSQTNTSVESTGLWQIASVDSQTQLTLSGFNGKAYSLNANGGLTYGIVNPITYKSISTWGSGDATIDGQNVRPVLLDLNAHSEIRVDSLKFINTYDDTNGAGGWKAAISSTELNGTAANPAAWTDVVNCIFENLAISSISYAGPYSVAENNYAQNVAYNGIGVGDYYTLDEGNTVIGPGTRCGLGGYAFSIIRNNYCKDMYLGYGGAHADGIGFLDGGPNGNNACSTGTSGGNCYGWIYDNTIDNTVIFLAIFSGNSSLHNWNIHNNVFIGRYGSGSGCSAYGEAGVELQGAPTNLVFANNDFIAAQCEGMIEGFRITSGYGGYPVNITLENNIFDTGVNAYYLDGGMPSGWVTDYNHYYNPNTTPFLINTTPETFAQWQTAGYDTHGINGTGSSYTSSTNPNFLSLINLDLRLSSSSPDIGAGTNLSSSSPPTSPAPLVPPPALGTSAPMNSLPLPLPPPLLLPSPSTVSGVANTTIISSPPPNRKKTMSSPIIPIPPGTMKE